MSDKKPGRGRIYGSITETIGDTPIVRLDRLAEKHGVALYPFFLDDVTTKPELQLDDGMHPNPAGVDVMVEMILPTAESFFKSIAAGE